MNLLPFSHTPGIRLLIPETAVQLQAFPTLLRFADQEIPLQAKGPLQNFTVIQDLQRHAVTIFSESYCYHLLPSLELVTKRPKQQEHEILDFGMHKKQLWEAMRTRLDFRELLPLWFRLGSLLSLPEQKTDGKGPFALLSEIESLPPEKVIPAFKKLFLVGFSDLFIPEAKDRFYQGILEEGSGSDPLYLLTLGREMIKSLFFKEEESGYRLLPKLPPELFAGTFTNIKTKIGKFSFTWSKKELRVAELRCSLSKEVLFTLPSQIRSFRIRIGRKGDPIKYKSNDKIELKENTHYYFDRFEK